MESVVLALENKYDDEVQFITADISNGSNPKTQSDKEAVELAQKYNVYSIPAIFLIDTKGQVVDQAIGAQTYEFLAAKIEKLLGK